MTRISHLSLSLLLVATTAGAQTPTSRVLLPIVATNLPGAFGSQWTTDLVVFNNSPHRADIAYSLSCLATCGSGVTLEAGQMFDVKDALPRPGVPALFLYDYLQDPTSDQVQVALRVRDVSQQANSWGAEVPVVRDADAFARPFDLLNVPLVARFRQTLRVYDLAATASGTVKVQYFAMLPARCSRSTSSRSSFPPASQAFPRRLAMRKSGFGRCAGTCGRRPDTRAHQSHE